jgi:hypothetical protein
LGACGAQLLDRVASYVKSARDALGRTDAAQAPLSTAALRNVCGHVIGATPRTRIHVSAWGIYIYSHLHARTLRLWVAEGTDVQACAAE